MQMSVSMDVLRLRIQQSLILLAASYVLASAQITCAEQDCVEFPIPPYNDVVVVPATIGGTEHLCVIDSGASRNLFDKSLRDKLGKPLGNASATAADGDRFEIETFQAPEIRIGSFYLRTASKSGLKNIQSALGFVGKEDRVACHDMTHFQEASARKIEGFIGMPLFREHIVQFDFDDRRLRILPTSASPSQDWGSAYNIAFTNQKLPTIDIELAGGNKETCIIDTGYDGTMSLESRLFSKLIEDNSILARDNIPFVQANGLKQTRAGQLSKVKLGEFESTDRRVKDGGKESRIGLTYLRQFRITFDCPRGRIYLNAGKGFNKPDREPAMGVGILLRNDKYVVENVAKSSPGERSGIQRGDEILAVNGDAIQGKPNAEIRSMCRDSMDTSGRVTLAVRRDGMDRQIVLLADK
jgi:hypothetical protein